MKRLPTGVIWLVALLALAQPTGSLTVVIPADVVAALSRAHAAEYQENQQRAAKSFRKLTEEDAPSTVQGMIQADLATVIAGKVQRYSPSDLPPRQPNEPEISQRNRYQSQVRSKITVK